MVEVKDLKCPVCEGELEVKEDYDTGEPVFYCDHGWLTVFIKLNEDNKTERIA